MGSGRPAPAAGEVLLVAASTEVLAPERSALCLLFTFHFFTQCTMVLWRVPAGALGCLLQECDNPRDSKVWVGTESLLNCAIKLEEEPALLLLHCSAAPQRSHHARGMLLSNQPRAEVTPETLRGEGLFVPLTPILHFYPGS